MLVHLACRWRLAELVGQLLKRVDEVRIGGSGVWIAWFEPGASDGTLPRVESSVDRGH